MLLVADGKPEAGQEWVFVLTETVPGDEADAKHLVATFVKRRKSSWGLTWNAGDFSVPMKTWRPAYRVIGALHRKH